jgi:hypothetical protein
LNIEEFTRLISNKPAFKLLNIAPEKRDEIIEFYTALAINEISTRFDFTFVIGRDTFDTIANQTDYEIIGISNDCRQCVSIWYDLDDNGEVNDEENVEEWTEIGIQNGHPLIRLKDAPITTGLTVDYKYRRKNVPINEFPDEWISTLIAVFMNVLTDAFKTEDGQTIFGSFDKKSEAAIVRMANYYRRSIGTYQRVQVDPETQNANRRRANLHGYN